MKLGDNIKQGLGAALILLIVLMIGTAMIVKSGGGA